jgi:hypothetical protein
MIPRAPVTDQEAPVNSEALPALTEAGFWQRYSPHHELPLSGVGSFTVHAVIIALLWLASITGFFALVGLTNTEPPPIDAVAIKPEGGGGGDPGGKGKGPGGKDRVEEVSKEPEPAPYDGPPLTEIPRARVDPVQFPTIARDPDGRRFIEKSNLALVALGQINRAAREAMMQGLAGKGKSGPGQDGGRDTGKGKGTGAGKGDGEGRPLTKREKRVLRWVLMFDTRDGQDYARQLDALGAILAVPEAGGQYRIIRDLKRRPVQGQVEDVSTIERIFWVDDVGYSVRSLALALGIEPVPPHLVAFFPQKLELHLLDLELKFRGLQEDDIQETRFRVIRRGAGYEVQVVDQIPMRR